MMKRIFGVPTGSGTNRAVQQEELARGFESRIKEEEKLYSQRH